LARNGPVGWQSPHRRQPVHQFGAVAARTVVAVLRCGQHP
jgi:hypothetical protein